MIIETHMIESQKHNLFTIGIDEVGRGPLAGPVAVGAFIFLKKDKKSGRQIKNIFRGVKESKQLTETEREKWFGKIQDARRAKLVDFRVALVGVGVIDENGISFAVRSALGRALKGLKKNPASVKVLLDGGLKAPPEYRHQKTIIKGDAKIQAIALASICAKVTRDRLMRRLAKKYLGYGFEIHKGYGTALHMGRIRAKGLSAIHRRTFCGSFYAAR